MARARVGSAKIPAAGKAAAAVHFNIDLRVNRFILRMSLSSSEWFSLCCDGQEQPSVGSLISPPASLDRANSGSYTDAQRDALSELPSRIRRYGSPTRPNPDFLVLQDPTDAQRIAVKTAANRRGQTRAP